MAKAAVERGTNAKRLEEKSADYLVMAPFWEKAEDAVGGEDVVKGKTVVYLPRFPDETDKEYTYRMSLAKYTNVYGDLLDQLVDKPFEQEITLDKGTDTEPVVHPEEIIKFVDDVDGAGNNITLFARDTFHDGVNNAVDWIFVDFAKNETGAIRSRADEERLGLRPYWSHVRASNVYEVQRTVINGKEELTYIRIFEPANNGEAKQFREMKMSMNGADRLATFQVWKWNTEANDYMPEPEGVITIGYIPMVPFITGRRNGKTWQFTGPMKGVLNLQFNLYRAESNLEYTKTVAAFPMLVGEGVSPKKMGDGPDAKAVRLVVGPGVVLYAPAGNNGQPGTFKYLEPGGSTLTFLQGDVKETKQDMRELGRAPLTMTTGQLSNNTTAMAAGKGKSAVKTWGVVLTDTLTVALFYTALWMGLKTYEPSVRVYDGYDDIEEGNNDISGLITLNSSGKLSDETLYEEMQRRSVLSSQFNYEQEKVRILANVVPPDPAATNPNNRRF